MRGASEPESFGALFARLADQARALVSAELALFRTDFYRRLGRAKIGMLMCLVGAIMGQAAAVTFLVTLSFVLQPWIGRLGGSAVAVVLGIGLAVGLIRFGVRRLMLVVDDGEDDGEERKPKDAVSIDILFDRVRGRSQEARNQLIDTFGEAQARLHPQALVADLADEIVDHAQSIAHRIAGAIRIRPYKLGGAALLAVLVIFRSPLARLVDRITHETSQPETSLKHKRAARPSRRRPGNNEEETPS